MLSHLEKNFNHDQGNDAMVVEARAHLERAVHSLQLAIESARHEEHREQANALAAVIRELQAQADLLKSLMHLKD